MCPARGCPFHDAYTSFTDSSVYAGEEELVQSMCSHPAFQPRSLWAEHCYTRTLFARLGVDVDGRCLQ